MSLASVSTSIQSSQEEILQQRSFDRRPNKPESSQRSADFRQRTLESRVDIEPRSLGTETTTTQLKAIQSKTNPIKNQDDTNKVNPIKNQGVQRPRGRVPSAPTALPTSPGRGPDLDKI